MSALPRPTSSDAPAPDSAPATIDALLGADTAPPPWWKRPSTWLLVALVLAAGFGLWRWQAARESAALPRYITEPATRGHLSVTVTANGTLQPTNKVDIGSELSGTVARVDVDVNDKVKAGQLLVQLDTAKLSDQVKRTRATLQVAQARGQQAAATVAESLGQLARLEEVLRLSGGKVPSQTELDAARASVARARADEASMRASVADAQAALSVDETNLRKASIRSPINGVVLSRSVEPGNAVAASLQAVTLLTLAEDLTKMKLQVNVDEADVGQVREGQRAQFTVSAWPGRNYPATVTRVGYGATTKDNVVTFLAELEVNNADLSLRPGMTVTAVITANERDDVLLVPNAALRFAPSSTQAPEPAASGTVVSKLVPRMPRQGTRRAGMTTAAARQVWVLVDGAPKPIAVTPGATDGRYTEVTSAELAAGTPVIVDQAASAR